MAVEFDDSDWKKALYVMSSDFDWKRICMLLAQDNPGQLYDLAMTSLMSDDSIVAKCDADKVKAELEAKIVAIMREPRPDKIKAIKEYRVATGSGLKEAKEAVEEIMDRYGIYY